MYVTLFLLYDLLLALVATKCVGALLRDRTRIAIPEALLAILALKIFFGCLSSLAVLFLWTDRTTSFAILAFIYLIIAITPFPWRGFLSRLAWRTPSFGELAVLLIYALVVSALAIGSIYPIIEIDSLGFYNAFYDWLANGASPYIFPYNYVSFWESSYIPALIFGHSKYLFWWNSAQPVALFGIGIYVLARQCALDRILALAISGTLVLLPAFWGLSGVPTLKNDAIANAGAIVAACSALAAVRGEFSIRFHGVLLGISLAFMTTKYTGIIQGFLVISFVIGWLWAKEKLNRTSFAVLLMTVSGIALVSTGHYYVKNLLWFGNPLYPVRVVVGSIVFPGYLQLSGTTIFDNVRHWELWRIFFDMDQLPWHRLGILFPLIILCAPISLMLVLLKRELASAETVVIGMFAIVGLLIFFSSFWSAGNSPGDFQNIRNFVSIRYATAPIAFSYLLVVLALRRIIRISAPLLTLLVAVEVVFRLQAFRANSLPTAILMDQVQFGPTLLLAGCLAAGMAAFWLQRNLPKLSFGLIAISILGSGLILKLSNDIAIRVGIARGSPWPAAEQVINRLSPSSVLVAKRFERPGPLLFHYIYYASGRSMERPVRIVEVDELKDLVLPSENGQVFFLSRYGIALDNELLKNFDEVLEPQGWSRVYSDIFSAIYVHASPQSNSKS